MSERETIRRIRDELMPEFINQFIDDNAEYPEERPLGARMEWAEIHRKVTKLKRPIWDGEEWTGREPVRRMVQEIIGHAFLLLLDLDGPKPKTVADYVREYGISAEDLHGPWPSGIVAPIGFAGVGPMPSPAPASEDEAYTAQRSERFRRTHQQAIDARKWRVAHCGQGCSEGHTYADGCQMAGVE